MSGLEKGGSREEYNNSKRPSKLAAYITKQEVKLHQFSDVDPKSDKVFHAAKQMKRENQDVMGEKCMRDDDGNFALSADAKK